MRVPFALKHALREGRNTWRRLGLYMVAITLGVAALVAINSFRANILEAIQAESRSLLGADLEIHSSRAFPDSVEALLDSLEAASVPISRMTTTPSMAFSTRTELSRLAQVKALDGAYPYYGLLETDPQAAWSELGVDRNVVVDPALLLQLDVTVGDTLQIGEIVFRIGGTVTTSPGEVSFQSAIGPRVFVHARHLDDSGLLRFGSLARYQAFMKIEENSTLQDFLNQYNQFFRDQQVGYDTVAERVEDLTFAIGNMTRFLGLVGLTALLLGGVGVASAVHVFIREKLDTVAVLRCLGATQRSVFAAYLLQAGLLGFAGAFIGVLLGIGIQQALPNVLGDFLPLGVSMQPDWLVVLAGLVIGVWVASIFALIPLLKLWGVAPLQAFRRDFETGGAGPRRGRWLAYIALGASVMAISVWQAPVQGAGVAFAVGIGLTTFFLWATARLLIWGTKRFFPRRARYVVRQGIANLFRPQNQTVAVVIALGFGVFLITTIYIVQENILDRFRVDQASDQPNLVAFDIQLDQRDSVRALVEAANLRVSHMTPIVPARIAGVNGRSVEEILADTTGAPVPRWALRREYRHTYRDTLVQTEELVEGAWWNDLPTNTQRSRSRVSIEASIADELQVGVGDHIQWNIQGVDIETEISSVRQVNWARFEPNFFVVFEPGALDDAPQSFVTMTRAEDQDARLGVQRDIVRSFSNVSVIDLGIVQQALDDIVGKVTAAIRFMALFSIASGVIVLVGAIGTSRYHRIRESVLLKTLGAGRRHITQIFSTEYATLGTLSAATGILLALVAGWGLVTFAFELTFRAPVGPLLGLWFGVVVLTTTIGLLSSRKVLTKPPLAVIREINE